MNKEELKRKTEEIFRRSGSHDELFDAFKTAVDNGIEDEDIYKLLVWNKALSVDEVVMYSEKLCSEFPSISFKIYFDTAKVLEATSSAGDNIELALSYYKKAADADPSSFFPYEAAARMYNKDLNIPRFERIVSFLLRGLDMASRKSTICFNLVDLYKQSGNTEKEKEFQGLGEKHQRRGK